MNFPFLIRLSCLIFFLAFVNCKPMTSLAIENQEEGLKTYNLLGEGIFPEGICIDKSNGTIYTGSINGGSIQKTGKGKSEYFLEPGNSIVSTNILGMAVDHKNNRLWVCSNDLKKFFQNEPSNSTLSIFDLSTGTLIHNLKEKDFPENFKPLFADVTTDKNGNAFVSNLSNNAIIKISEDFSTIDIFSDFPKAPDGKFYILNGLDVKDNNLIIAAYNSGYKDALAALFRMDTQNGIIEEILITESVNDFKENGIDGLTYLNNNTVLGVSGNGKILKITLNNSSKEANIYDISSGTKAELFLNEPSTIAVMGNKVYTTNSQANRFFSQEKAELPFKILEIPFNVLRLDY